MPKVKFNRTIVAKKKELNADLMMPATRHSFEMLRGNSQNNVFEPHDYILIAPDRQVMVTDMSEETPRRKVMAESKFTGTELMGLTGTDLN